MDRHAFCILYSVQCKVFQISPLVSKVKKPWTGRQLFWAARIYNWMDHKEYLLCSKVVIFSLNVSSLLYSWMNLWFWSTTATRRRMTQHGYFNDWCNSCCYYYQLTTATTSIYQFTTAVLPNNYYYYNHCKHQLTTATITIYLFTTAVLFTARPGLLSAAALNGESSSSGNYFFVN